MINTSIDQQISQNSENESIRNLRIVLIVLSSILLGIWAVKETIALRNILLVLGVFLSIHYIYQELKRGQLKEQLTFWKLLPIGLITLAFIWVVLHYFLFSIDPLNQLKELKSTWLRAFLASVVGLGTGLALRNHSNRLAILWLGVFVSFIVLFTQYLPKAIEQQQLLVTDYDHYLFHLKINTVLMGTLLLAGIDGALFDYLLSIGYRSRIQTLGYVFYWIIGTLITLWAFVYIVDTRNGIGLSIILHVFWLICGVVLLISGREKLNLKKVIIFTLGLASLIILSFFILAQMKVNPGWTTLVEDVKIAVQVDRYPNWQNPAQMGYPKNSQGQTVTVNNYERIAWAVAGSRAILQKPQGVGVLSYPFALHSNGPKKMHEFHKPRISTHSGWVELGLAFGLVILVLIFSAITLTFIVVTTKPYPAKMTVLGLLVLILFLFATGEVAIDHGLEILFYFLAFLPALLFINVENSPKSNKELISIKNGRNWSIKEYVR